MVRKAITDFGKKHVFTSLGSYNNIQYEGSQKLVNKQINYIKYASYGWRNSFRWISKENKPLPPSPTSDVTQEEYNQIVKRLSLNSKDG